MTFGEKLRKLRKEKGWTQEELAAQIHISRQALSKWEQGSVLPDTENVLQLSRLFGVSTDYLLRDNFESDADLPAVKDTGDRMRKKLNRAVGLAVSGMGILGLLVLAIVGANYCEVYPMTPDGVEHRARGLAVLLESHNLYWLAALLLTLAAAGVFLAFWPRKK